jgi:hypothetical protein
MTPSELLAYFYLMALSVLPESSALFGSHVDGFNLYSSLNIGMVKQMIMRWLGHVTHDRDEKYVQNNSCKA